MHITLNGERVEITSQTLFDALTELGYGDMAIATALNSEFVPITLRTTINLKPGDTLEVLAPMQGG